MASASSGSSANTGTNGSSMGLRADRKKMAKKFRIGDIVTWGRGIIDAEVVEVSHDGLYVDTKLEDGTPAPRHFVPYVPGPKYGSTIEPPRLVRRPL